MTLELNNAHVRSAVENYYQEIEYSQPPESICYLFENRNYISKVHYLYDHFAKNNSIKNKRKRLAIVDVFYRLVHESIGAAIEECDGTNEDIINETIMRIINIPAIVVNFDPSKNLIEQTYREIIGHMKNLSRKIRLNIINRMVVLGQEALIFQEGDDDTFDTIKKNFVSITKNHKILIYFVANDQKRFREIIESLDELNKQCLIQKLIFSQQLKPSQAQLLNQVNLSRQSQTVLLTNLLGAWCDARFLNQTPYVQKLLTNYLCLKIKKTTKEYLESVMAIVNKGITQRFEYSKSFEFVRESGLIIWKAYAKGLQLQESIEGELNELLKRDLFEDDVQLQAKDARSILVTHSKKVMIPIPTNTKANEEQSKEENAQEAYLFTPKNLYDCYLGLTSDNYRRKEICLKAITNFVRTGESDLIFQSSKILNILLFLHDKTSSIRNFSKLRMDAITSLIVFEPVQSVRSMTNRFYNKECCLADKIMILNSMNAAVTELSNNPEKYKIDVKSCDQQFYFKKVTSKYYRSEDEVKKQKQTQRIEKLEGKSRRWGHTKKAHELLRLSEQGSTLIPVANKDLLVSDPFVNRLYELVDEIFFTFVYKIASLDHLFSEITFMDCLFGTLNTFLENIQNYHKKYRIAQEVIDILRQVKSKNPQIQKGKLGVVLKMVGILDKNLNYHELLLLNLQDVIGSFYEFQKTSYDPSVKIILDIVQQRPTSLLSSNCSRKKENKVFVLSQF